VAGILNHELGRGSVVDAGGGEGNLYRLLKAELRSDYTVVDAERTGAGRRLVSELASIPLPDGTAQGVVLSDVLEHLPDEQPVLKECWRLVKPGGLLVIHTPSLKQPAFDFIRRARRLAEERDEQPFPHVRDGYDFASIKTIVGQATRTEVHALPSFSRAESVIADLDWWLWDRSLNVARALTWCAIRVASRMTRRRCETSSHGILVIARRQ
jgi:ubiquinone/menaquinone biosynthesis C-methylase UbiE